MSDHPDEEIAGAAEEAFEEILMWQELESLEGRHEDEEMDEPFDEEN